MGGVEELPQHDEHRQSGRLPLALLVPLLVLVLEEGEAQRLLLVQLAEGRLLLRLHRVLHGVEAGQLQAPVAPVPSEQLVGEEGSLL